MTTFREIEFKAGDDGKMTATLGGTLGGMSLSYWKAPEAAAQDPWRYEGFYDDTRCVYSHPTEQGCQFAIYRTFVDRGLIQIPEDNSHLDEIDAQICAETFAAYDARPGVRNGDFLDMGDGTFKRACHLWDHGAQVTKGGSYYISRCGGVSYSGGLDPSILFERWEPTDETMVGRFWFFKHGRAGAGRGIDVLHRCRVFRLIDFTMTEEEARAHGAAKDTAEFWGENSREHLKRVAALMRGEMG